MRTVAQLMELSSRRALITGGAGHVGVVIGEALQELGAQVALLDRPAAFRARAAAVDRLGPNVLRLTSDLERATSARKAVREAIRRWHGLDILIHCAAYTAAARRPGWAVPFAQQRLDAWDTALRVNLTSAFTLVQEARQALAASGHGSVILMASIYGLAGPDHRLYEGTSMGNPAAYHASKGGLLQLMRYLATTLAPRVRVNAVSPGGIARQQAASFRRRYISKTPLARMAIEEDVKGAVAYLASDLSAYVTGHNLVVDGGWTAW